MQHLQYSKCLKISNNLFQKFYGLNFAFFMLLFHKMLGGMANNVDPDQTAPSGAVRSGSTLFA